MNLPDAEAPAAHAGPRVRPVPAVSRAIAILRLLGRSATPMTLKTIAQSLQMVTSTCLHILRVLVEEGLVKVDPTSKRYSLDTGMLSLARSVIETHPFPTLAQPALDRIADAWSVTAIGVEVQGADELVVMALARSRAPFRLHVDVGSRFAAMTSATGRLVAAYANLPPPELSRRFKAAKWDNAPDLETWTKEVEAVRRKGYSVDRGNYVGGLLILAVPVFDGVGRMTHALVAAGFDEQFGAPRVQALAKELQAEAQRISSLLGVRG